MRPETVPAKTIVTRTKDSGWFGTDYNMNIYRGCCHGCIYCDSRSECYGIEDFDRVRVKADALRVIRDDLRRKVKTGVVATGSMSDPYNPLEETLELSRHALELLDAYGFGAAVATKGALVARDGDILESIASHSPVIVKITVTTADEALAAKIEPHAPPPSARLKALEALAARGLFCGVLLMPLLPFITATEANIRAVLGRVADAGARFVYPALGVTLRGNQRAWFYDRLEEAFPGEGLAQRYDRRYGEKYRCGAPGAGALWQILTAECGRLGLLHDMRDIIRTYKQGYDQPQMTLF